MCTGNPLFCTTLLTAPLGQHTGLLKDGELNTHIFFLYSARFCYSITLEDGSLSHQNIQWLFRMVMIHKVHIEVDNIITLCNEEYNEVLILDWCPAQLPHVTAASPGEEF